MLWSYSPGRSGEQLWFSPLKQLDQTSTETINRAGSLCDQLTLSSLVVRALDGP